MTVNLDVEFFEGENGEALLHSTLNDIQVEDLWKFVEALNGFIDCGSFPDYIVDSMDYPASKYVDRIEITGCDDALVYLRDGSSIEISSETTFWEILEAMAEAHASSIS